MEIKNIIKQVSLILVALLFAASAFAQDSMFHEAEYHMDGRIDFKQQVGDDQGTGAKRKQTIAGEGEMNKALQSVQISGKLTMEDTQDWTTAENAAQNLTVTSAIELCAPGMQEYTTTKYELTGDVDNGIPVGEGQYLLTGYTNPVPFNKVMPLYDHGYGSAQDAVYNEEDGRYEFYIAMEKEPGALIFIKEDDDGNDNFKGYLSLSDNLAFIPSQYLDDGVDEVDLGAVNFNDKKVEPDYNPLEEELAIAENDLEATAVAGTFFSALAMSPDLVEAALDDQFIYIGNNYHTSGFNLIETADNVVETEINNDFAIELHKFNMSFTNGFGNYNDLRLSYPDNTIPDLEPEAVQNSTVFFHEVGDEDRVDEGEEGPPVPPAGSYNLYTANNNDLDLTFTLPDISGTAEEHLVLPKPEVHLTEEDNGNQYIQEIRWEYVNAKGDGILEPGKILDALEVQIESFDNGEHERVFDSGNINVLSGITSINLEEENIPWDEVDSINITYDDIYGLHYVVPFFKVED